MKDAKAQAGKPTGAAKPGGLNSEIQSRIGHQLRAMYDDVVRQGVPDKFADLIKKLDASDGKKLDASDGLPPPPGASAGSSNSATKTDGRD